MQGYRQSREVEATGLRDVLDFIAYFARYTTTDGGLLGEWIQKNCRDVLANIRSFDTEGKAVFGPGFTIELKVEAANKYANFFLETWSNRTFGRQTVGWAYTCKSDALFYYFAEEKDLYILPFARLWEWAFVGGNIWKWPEKVQDKYSQLNTTCGRPVPIEEIRRAVGFRFYHMREDGLWVLKESVGKHNAWPERPAVQPALFE